MSEDGSRKPEMESVRTALPLMALGCLMTPACQSGRDDGYGRMLGSEDRSEKTGMESLRISQSRRDVLLEKETIKNIQVPSARPIHAEYRIHPSVANRKMNPLV